MARGVGVARKRTLASLPVSRELKNLTIGVPQELTAHLAYLKWLDEDCIHGRDRAHWYQAEAELLSCCVHALAVHDETSEGNSLCLALRRMPPQQAIQFLRGLSAGKNAGSQSVALKPRLHRPSEEQEGSSSRSDFFMEDRMDQTAQSKKVSIKNVEGPTPHDDLAKATFESLLHVSNEDREKYSGQFAVIARLGKLRGHVVAAGKTFAEGLKLAAKTGRPDDYLVKQLP